MNRTSHLGYPALIGNFEIGGVPGTGPCIDLDFAYFDGSCLNRGLFPTGARRENPSLPDRTTLPVTILDMTNLNVLVQAEDLGVDLTRPYDRLQGDTDLLDRLDQTRATVLINVGMATPEAAAETIRRSVNPLVHILAPPQLYRDLTGRTVEAATHDVLSRSY